LIICVDIAEKLEVDMADIRRNVRAIGQRISGLQAGETYTFVLKRPKPAPDLTNARRCVKLTSAYIDVVRSITDELDHAHQRAMIGDSSGAKTAFQKAKSLFDGIGIAVSNAHGHAEDAKGDSADSPSETKDAYESAAKAAELSIKHADWVAKGLDEVFRAVAAFIDEVSIREHG
jgi:hypothetical protein